MKVIKYVTVFFMTMGIVGFGLGCGKSSSGGNSAANALNAMAPADLTASDITSAAVPVMETASMLAMPTNVSQAMSGGLNFDTNPVFSCATIYICIDKCKSDYQCKNNCVQGDWEKFHRICSDELEPWPQATSPAGLTISRQSMGMAVLKGPSFMETASAAGFSCTSGEIITDNSTANTVDITETFINAQCTLDWGPSPFPYPFGINGMTRIQGTFDETTGTVDLTRSLDIAEIITGGTTGESSSITLRGSIQYTGSGLVTGSTDGSYAKHGTIEIAGSDTSGSTVSSYSGSETIDTKYTGSPSHFTYQTTNGINLNQGNAPLMDNDEEMNVTVTTSGENGTDVTVIGTAEFGEEMTQADQSEFEGRVSVKFLNTTFAEIPAPFPRPPVVIPSDPTGGTIDITGANAFIFDFNRADGADYGCPVVNGVQTCMVSDMANRVSQTYWVYGNPNAIAIDASGNVWVASTINSGTIMKLNISGTTVGTYTVGSQPQAMAIDANGNVWVALYVGNVIKLSSSGTTLGTYDVGYRPSAIAIDANGDAWVANYVNSTLTELSNNVTSMGVYSLNSVRPNGIAIDASGNVWLTSNPVVIKLNSNGTYMGQYRAGSIPYAIAIDASGNVWATNCWDNTVTELSNSGTTLGTYNVGKTPQALAIDADGNVWVANYDDGTITQLSGSGAILGTYTVGSNPVGIAVDAAGNVWVANYGNGSVTKISR